jgi:hypothetical protein
VFDGDGCVEVVKNRSAGLEMMLSEVEKNLIWHCHRSFIVSPALGGTHVLHLYLSRNLVPLNETTTWKPLVCR